MKAALLALTVFVFASCTNTLYNHRSDFERPKAKGPWTNYYKTVKAGGDPSDPSKRPLFGERN